MIHKRILIFGMMFINGCVDSNSDTIRDTMQKIVETAESDYANANMDGQ